MTAPAARDRRRRSVARALACSGMLLLAGRAAVAANEGGPPYDPSTTITDFEPDWGTFRRLAPGSDNWATTWAGDGSVYAAWGDGGGFGTARVSLGFARLMGNSAASVHGTNLAGTAPKGKSYGLLALGRTLYAWISPGSNAANYGEARLYAAPLGTNQWKAATWAFTKDDAAHLILPTLLQAGRNYAQVTDFVYVYAARYDPKLPGQLSIQSASRKGQIALLRAPKRSDLLARDSWEFYAGDAGWSKNAGDLVPVIEDPNGVGWTVSAAYDPGLKRVLVATEHDSSFASKLSLFASQQPEGPYETVAYTTLDDPQGRVQSTAFYYNFLADSFSENGKGFTLVFTGTGNADALNLVDGSFTVKAGGGDGGSGNPPGGNGNGNGSDGGGTGCTTGTTSSSTTAQSSSSGSSGNLGTQGSAGTVETSTNNGTDAGTSTDTGCTGDTGTSDEFTTFGGGGYYGSSSGQTTGQQGSRTTTQQGSQSTGTGSTSFSLDPQSFRRDTNTGAGAPPKENDCDTGGTRLLKPRADHGGGKRDLKGGASSEGMAGKGSADAAEPDAADAAEPDAAPGIGCGK